MTWSSLHGVFACLAIRYSHHGYEALCSTFCQIATIYGNLDLKYGLMVFNLTGSKLVQEFNMSSTSFDDDLYDIELHGDIV